MKIANILTTVKIDTLDDFNIVNSSNDLIDGLPTLIVGYDYVNKFYPDFDITNIELGPNIYWTFRKNEKRDKYEEDLNWFIRKVYSDLINSLSYVFVDPIQYKRKTLLKIIRKIYSSDNIISYEHDNMIYIYCDKIIFGLDLKLLKFMGVDFKRIKSKIKSISTVFLEKNEILIEYKNIISFFDNKMRYLPYLYFIKNGQNNTFSLLHISRES